MPPSFLEQLGAGFLGGAVKTFVDQSNQNLKRKTLLEEAEKKRLIANPELATPQALADLGFAPEIAKQILNQGALVKGEQVLSRQKQELRSNAKEIRRLQPDKFSNETNAAGDVIFKERSPKEIAQAQFQADVAAERARGATPRDANLIAGSKNILGAPRSVASEVTKNRLTPKTLEIMQRNKLDPSHYTPAGLKALAEQADAEERQEAADKQRATSAASAQGTALGNASTRDIQAETAATIARERTIGAAQGEAIGEEIKRPGALQTQAQKKRQTDILAQIDESRTAISQASQSTAVLRTTIAAVQSKIPQAYAGVALNTTLNRLKAEFKVDPDLDTFNQISQTLTLQMARIIDPSGRVSDQDRVIAAGFVPLISDTLEVIEAKLAALDSIQIMRAATAAEQSRTVFEAGGLPEDQRLSSQSIFPPDAVLFAAVPPGSSLGDAKIMYLKQKYGLKVFSAAHANKLLDTLDAFNLPRSF